MFSYKHPHPAVTVDAVVFGVDAVQLRILLIQRKADPFKGQWALPGGFVNVEPHPKPDESLDVAAARELYEETRLKPAHLEQLYTFGDIGRDPRERTITVAYLALVRPDAQPIAAGSDAKKAEWFPVDALPPLAFDHRAIVDMALVRLRAKVRYAPIGFGLLPERFTIGDLQNLYERILGRGLDTSAFRRKVLALNVLKKRGVRKGPHRPAPIYSFDRDAYDRLTKRGINFEI